MRHFDVRSVTETNVWPFVIGLLASCLFLQRFGIVIGNQSLNIVGPIGLALAIAGVISGQLAVHVTRLSLYFTLLAVMLAGNTFNTANPLPFVGFGSIPSFIQFAAITGFTVFSFANPKDERVFFSLVQKFLLVIALVGIVQFFLQMAGLRLFSFTGVLPQSILVENGWNLEIASGVGDLLKSNGFFLVEPSVMSQFMAMGLAAELLYFRRSSYLAVFVVGLLVSFSGTGFLVLFGFVLGAALRLGWRGVALALLLVAVLATAAALTMLLEPGFAGAIEGRLNEISTPGTSGHMRFVTPFWLFSDLLDRVPTAAVLGIGAGTSEHLTLPYEYDVNTPVKISLEYGLPAFVLYVALFLVSERTARQSVLVLPGMVLLMLTGAYQQFAPIVFFITLLLCTARLTTSDPA